ncbi:MAG: hypothetical protein FWD16_04695 [Clostridia bacterium]|nr:hypothetical protein [Clostridia bacterium]
MNKMELQTHFRAQYWRYLLLFGLVMVFCVASAPMFAPKIPPEDTVTVRFFGDVYMGGEIGVLEKELIAAHPDIKKLSLQSETAQAGSISTIYMALQGLLPGYADVIIGALPDDVPELLRPLDEFFEDGAFPEKLKEHAEKDANGKIIALSAAPLRRLERKDILKLTDAVCAIPYSSQNPAGAARVIAWFYENALT